MEKTNLFTILTIVGLIIVGVSNGKLYKYNFFLLRYLILYFQKASDQAEEARIIGGSTIKPNEWAAHVYITIDAAGNSTANNCSGTLIDFKTVLVSGYCNISFIFKHLMK